MGGVFIGGSTAIIYVRKFSSSAPPPININTTANFNNDLYQWRVKNTTKYIDNDNKIVFDVLTEPVTFSDEKKLYTSPGILMTSSCDININGNPETILYYMRSYHLKDDGPYYNVNHMTCTNINENDINIVIDMNRILYDDEKL